MFAAVNLAQANAFKSAASNPGATGVTHAYLQQKSKPSQNI
jgi:hypothetical protein